MDTLNTLRRNNTNKYITIEGDTNSFKIQNGPIKDFGENGCQIDELGKVWLYIIESLNQGDYRCRENSIAITKIEEALMWQEARTRDRVKRNVEGHNKK